MKTISVASAWLLSTFAAAPLLGVVIVSTAAMAQDVMAPGTSLGIASVPNLRDAGGYTTADGSVVRRGVAYRSNQLNPISADDMKKIAALGLRNDFDLRTAEEREAKPDELPAGVKNVWLNVLAAWRTLTEKAGLPGFRFHDLRHCAITQLAENGTSDSTIMAIAGHVSRRMLERYSHVRMEAKRTAMETLAVSTKTAGYDTNHDTNAAVAGTHPV